MYENEKIEKQKLIKFCTEIFLKLKMDHEKAQVTSELLVEADMMGHNTHGVRLISNYVQDIINHKMKINGNYIIMSDKESSLTIDGCLLPGIWLTQKGVDKAISRSKKFGVSTVTIGNSHHNGALAAYFPKIIDMGLIGIIKSSVPSAASVAPFGGTQPLLTPNPMAIGFPTENLPVIIDISASITTNNMISAKIANNEKFDFNCLLTSDGKPTNDPFIVKEKNGTVLPVGGMEYGHKGFGLALGIEALTQGLSGFGRIDVPKSMNLSTFIQIIDPEFFSGLQSFKKQMSFTINKAKSNKPIEGKTIFIPGERALKKRQISINEGIELNEVTINQLIALSKKFDISF